MTELTSTFLNVHSIETFGTQEGPGIRLVLFLQGCPLRCVFCHNPDTKDVKENKLMSVSSIVEMVLKEKAYFGCDANGKNCTGGITISGGEPLLQAKELILLFKELKKRGINTALDTSGSVFNEFVKELLEYTDLVLLDIKHADATQYNKVTEGKIETFLEFFEYLEKRYLEDESRSKVWLRYVLMPNVTDDIAGLKLVGEKWGNYSCVERIEILPYHTYGINKYKEMGIEYKYPNLPAASEEDVQKAKEIFEKSFDKVFVR